MFLLAIIDQCFEIFIKIAFIKYNDRDKGMGSF